MCMLIWLTFYSNIENLAEGVREKNDSWQLSLCICVSSKLSSGM